MTSEQFLERLQAGEKDFSGLDLSGIRVKGKTIADASFDGAFLKKASLIKCDLRRSTFLGVELGGAPPNLSLADLKEAHLRGRWDNLSMNAARLDKARLEGSYDGSKFSFVTLKKASLAGCSANNSMFDRCSFIECDLEGAQLRNCGFVACHFGDANLSGADLSGSFFKECTFDEETNWEGALLEAVSGLDETPDTRHRISEDLLSEAFGPDAVDYLDQAFDLLGCPIVEEFAVPMEFEQAMDELLGVEAELLDRTSQALSDLKYFALSARRPFPIDEGEEFERALFDFGKQFFPSELQFQQNGSEEFEGDPHPMKILDTAQYRSWLSGYIHNSATNDAAQELGLDQEERNQALLAFLEVSQESLFGDSETVRVYDLANEMDNENIEFGVHLVVGKRSALSITRHWLL